MDFLERLFGLAPDGGTGVVEGLLVIAPMLALYLARRAIRRVLARGRRAPGIVKCVGATRR